MEAQSYSKAGVLPKVTIDFETRSRSPLKKAGAYKYSLDPSTQPTCLSLRIKGVEDGVFLNFEQINTPFACLPHYLKELIRTLVEGGAIFVAHNAFFEKCIYYNILVKRLGWPEIPFRHWRCTAAKAASCALPRNLEGAADVMELAIRKDRRGYSAMMATCKPTKQFNAWHEANKKIKEGRRVNEATKKKAAGPCPPEFLEPQSAPDVFKVLYEYCEIDVKTEEALDDALPDLNEEELEIWQLNQLINWRGLPIDVPTIKKVVAMMAEDTSSGLKELDSLTMGLVTKPGARKSILDFLAMDGIILQDIRAKTVDDALRGDSLSEDMRRLLEIRKSLSLTSTRKYHSFLDRVNKDGRVRDITLYHGASTGRETGTGVQPHNFPRGTIKMDENRPYATVENIAGCEPDMIRLLYGDSLGLVFSAILRNMITASKGYELFVADFSQIEVAVLWWLADNFPGLQALKAGKDPYLYQAASNMGKSYEEIEAAYKRGEQWAKDARQLGKAQVLGCGFGMGAPKFLLTAWDMYRLKLSEEQSAFAVSSYRTANAAVPLLWKNYERYAVAAVENPSQQYEIGNCKFIFTKGFLWAELPSGRRLAYKDPQITMRETDYGPRKTLEFWAVNSKTKKWTIERTWGGTLTENIVQAVARDLMMAAIVRLENAGFRALLTVHDEAICESKLGEGDLDEFTKVMCEAPKWARGLPLKAAGWKGPRYRK